MSRTYQPSRFMLEDMPGAEALRALKAEREKRRLDNLRRHEEWRKRHAAKP
jgi:hypothetical protein